MSSTLREMTNIAISLALFIAMLVALFNVADWHEAASCMAAGRELHSEAKYTDHTCFIQRMDGWHPI